MNKELKDKELEKVNGGTEDDVILNPSRRCSGGTVILHNMPKINPDEKYVMGVNPTDINIINTCRPTTSK